MSICYFYEGIAKRFKKLKYVSQYFFEQERTANPANLTAIFLPVLTCPQTAKFLQSPYQVDMKNVAKCWINVLLCFTTLETMLNHMNVWLNMYNWIDVPNSGGRFIPTE